MLTYLLVPTLALLPTWLSRASAPGRPGPEGGERWRYSYVISVLVLVFARRTYWKLREWWPSSPGPG